jgi:C4-dicarboxylate transporter DctQ subunit
MKSFENAVTAVEEAVLALLLAAMTLVTFFQVVARYVFHSGWLAALECTTTLFSWLVLFGISYGVKMGTHLGVDAFVRLLPRPVFRATAVFAALACILYAIILLNADWLKYLFGLETRGGAVDYWYRMYMIGIGLEDLRLPEFMMQLLGFRAETLPRWVAYIILPVGLALFALRSVQAMWAILHGRRETIIAAHEGESLITDKTLLQD